MTIHHIMFFPKVQFFPTTTGSIKNLNTNRTNAVIAPKPIVVKSCHNGLTVPTPNGLKRYRNRKINNPKKRIVKNLLFLVPVSLYGCLKGLLILLNNLNKTIHYLIIKET